MTRDYRDIGSGKVLSINLKGNEFLARITLGIWNKLGFMPKTEEDCKIVGRICRNYIKFQEWQKYNSFKFAQENYGLEKLSDVEIKWLQKVADFFENAKGIDPDY